MKKIIITVVVIIALGVAYWLISPLFIDREVNETMADISPTGEANILATGSFVGLDGHSGSGTAELVQTSDGNYIRFEDDFRVTNGPDLFVYLGQNGQYDPDTRLAGLKGNIGSQNYKIPENISLDNYNEVWVWCRAFSVPFAKAELN